MTRVILDEEMRKKLLDCIKPLELCNEAGIVLARLTPSPDGSDPDDWDELTPPVSDEEIQRRIDSDEPTFTTQDLVERIQQL
jgi:hypothetical protein